MLHIKLHDALRDAKNKHSWRDIVKQKLSTHRGIHALKRGGTRREQGGGRKKDAQ